MAAPPPDSALASPSAPDVAGLAAPPHDLEAEMSVLGSILISDRTLYALVIEEGLKGEDFYRERHRLIYESMLALYHENEPVDVVTVTDHIRQRGRVDEAGGASAVDALAAAPPSVSGARRYAQIVREHALLRRLLTTTYRIQAEVGEHRYAPRDLVERTGKSMLQVAHDDRHADFRAISAIPPDELRKMELLSKHGTALTGTPPGFKDLDEITGGFQPGNLVIVAARPSMGKSALVTNIAENAAIDHERAVAMFSLEMSETELAQRFVASQGRIFGDKLRKGRVPDSEWPRILEASQRLARAPRRPTRELVGTTPEVVAVAEHDCLVSARADKVWLVGRREVFAVRLATGRVLRATAHPRIRCGAGWRRVSDLAVGERVAL